MIGWFLSGVAFGVAAVNLVFAVVRYVVSCKRSDK